MNWSVPLATRLGWAAWLHAELKAVGCRPDERRTPAHRTPAHRSSITEFARQHGLSERSLFRWLGLNEARGRPEIPSPTQCAALAEALAQAGRYVHPLDVLAQAGYFSEDELLDYVRYHNRINAENGEPLEVSA